MPAGISAASRRARQAVRTIRDGTAAGGGEMAVPDRPQPPRRPCVEIQGNARHSDPQSASRADQQPDVDDGSPLAFESQLKPLTARQLTAIGLLTMGKSVIAVARSIQVDPATLHRWKARNPLFVAELNRRQAALFDGMVVKLRLTMDRAVNELMAVLSSPSKRDRTDAMWRLLPMIRPQRLIVPVAPTDAADVVDAQIRAGRTARGEIEEAPITEGERLEQVPAEFREPPSPTVGEDGAAEVADIASEEVEPDEDESDEDEPSDDDVQDVAAADDGRTVLRYRETCAANDIKKVIPRPVTSTRGITDKPIAAAVLAPS